MKKLLANWGNFPVIKADDKCFSFDDDLTSIVQNTNVYIARGNGRCYGDAALAETTITTTKYNKILSFDTTRGILVCQSGITLDNILEVIIPKGWFLPVTPGTKFITIGGAVASDVHGKNHHVDGSFSNHILEMEVLLANEERLLCSSSQNTDLFLATCGGMGLTGIITKVMFQLKKIETSYISQKQIKAKNLEDVLKLFEKYKYYTYSVAWIDCLQTGENFGRSILMLGEHAQKDQLNVIQLKNPLQLALGKQIRFPFFLPSWILNSFTVKLFNTLFYAKNIKKEINNIVNYESFFYPLDAIHDWNKGYGRKGFLQYQFVLPLNAKEGLIEILHKISDKGFGSFLAVLKVFGQQQSLISFPKEGYTLALDFPVRDNLFPFLDELDKIVIKYGGRLYMSKDARMNSDILRAGYPELQEFKNIVKKYNPSNRIRSIQSDRLKLT